MRKIFIALTLILLSSGLFAAKPVVAVWEIDNKTVGKNKLSQYDAEIIADLMRDELIQSQEFTVMSKEEMESAIAQHVKKSHQLNKDKNYAIELGKQISARYIITSQIKTDGKFFRIFAEIIDTETGRSPRSGKGKFSMDDDSKDAAIAGLIRQLLGERDESARPKKSDDQRACEKARSSRDAAGWIAYKKRYSDGICIEEADKELDKMGCELAKSRNTVEDWEKYLDRHPKGICSMDADMAILRLKRQEKSGNGGNSGSSSGYAGSNNGSSHDAKACKYSQSENSIEAWQDYLDSFPNGECSFEAESKIEEIKKKNRGEQLKKATNGNEKLRIAVMEFEDQTEKLPKKILSEANEYIYSAFINSNKYIVVADAKNKVSIREKRKKMLHSGQNNISIGREISAQTILRPKIISFAGKYTVFFELIDLEKSAIMNGFKETFDGNEKSFSVAVKNIVAKFLDASINIAFDKKPIIAIADFDSMNKNLPKKTIENATEYMRNNIISLNKYIVTPQDRETAIIKKYIQESYSLAVNSDYRIKLNGKLSAQTILRTEITSFGGKYSITSTFIDPAKKVVVSGAKAIFDGSESSLLLAIDNIAELFEKNNYPTKIVNLDKPVIAIRDFEDETGNLSKKMLENAVEYIQNAFFGSNKYFIVPAGNANTIISRISKEIQEKSYHGDPNFEIPIEQDISTNNFLFTTISFSANRYLISSELIDTEQAFTLKRAKATFDGSEESLAQAIDNIVEQIAR